MTSTLGTGSRPTKLRLWGEFLLLFIGVPIAMLVFFGSYSLFGALAGLTAIAAILLAVTPGFRIKELRQGPVLGEWRLILVFAAVTAAVCLGLASVLVPERMFGLMLAWPERWLTIMLLYPIVSAAPQELIFRPLFFRRYGALFPNEGVAVFANAFVFGFGHLFYQNPVVILMTTAGGVLFALAYLRHRSFLLAWVLHAIAGQIVFTAGLGIYFYHGAV